MTDQEKTQIDNWFTCRELNENQAERHHYLLVSARQLAIAIMSNAPGCADRSAALRQLRECVATATAAITQEEPVASPDKDVYTPSEAVGLMLATGCTMVCGKFPIFMHGKRVYVEELNLEDANSLTAEQFVADFADRTLTVKDE